MPDKVYSIQPRFKPPGDQSTGGWAWVDSLFNWGLETVMPIYPSPARDMYLGQAWRYEPVLAGAIGTAVDKMAASDWSIKGGRNTINRCASLCHKADGGAGWAHMVSELYQDYISTNRGAMMELGRSSSKSRTGPVLGLQHMDSTRVMYTGDPNKPWRYLPVPDADGADLWAENIIQIVSMPSPRDRFRGSGLCAVERLRDSIELMVGWLTHDRQMVGNLPPEALLIINGLDKTRVDESLQSYKARREAILKHQSGADPVYAGFWMLGNSNPANNVTAEIVNLRRTDQYDRNGIYEWWVKLIALNLGQSVGEFWLIQHAGATKAVEGIQAAMQSSKGVGRFAQELEWQLNTRIFKPANVTFSFDTQDELADAGAADILATNAETLLKLSQIADPMGSPAFTLEELKQLAVEWGIIEPEMIGENVPMQIGAKLKEFAQDDVVRYGNDGSIRQVKPLVGPAMREQFKELAGMLEDAYSVDKHLPGKHDQMTHGNWAGGLTRSSWANATVRKLSAALGDKFHIDERGKQLLTENSSEGERFRERILMLSAPNEKAWKDFAAAGLSIYAEDGTVPDIDDMHHLKGVRPRGWGPGQTWDKVSGCYSPSKSAVMIGSNGVGGGVMALHETTHALDYKTNKDGTKVSASAEFNKAYRQVMAPPNLAQPYYKQAGGAGREELFATSCAVVWRARQIGMAKAREEGDVKSSMYDPVIGAAQAIIKKRGW